MPGPRPRRSTDSDSNSARPRTPGFGSIPRVSELLDASDEMIAFVEKYQQAWQHESRAMIALGEFLAARADALRTQAELMRMGSDVARRYGAWSDALMALRPESIVQSWMQTMQRGAPNRAEDE